MIVDLPEKVPLAPLPNTYWVVAGQFLAGEHPADPDEASSRKRLAALLEAGIRLFVDLTGQDELHQVGRHGGGYHFLMRSLVQGKEAEATYMRVPIPDHSVPLVWTLRRILDLVDRSAEDENPVFVHCRAGLGRTGTVAGCYLKRHGIASEQDVTARIAELGRLMPNGPVHHSKLRPKSAWSGLGRKAPKTILRENPVPEKPVAQGRGSLPIPARPIVALWSRCGQTTSASSNPSSPTKLP